MTYRATADIYTGPGVCAFRTGDIVPDAVVKNLGIEDKVAREGTKAAKEVAPKP